MSNIIKAKLHKDYAIAGAVHLKGTVVYVDKSPTHNKTNLYDNLGKYLGFFYGKWSRLGNGKVFNTNV